MKSPRLRRGGRGARSRKNSGVWREAGPCRWPAVSIAVFSHFPVCLCGALTQGWMDVLGHRSLGSVGSPGLGSCHSQRQALGSMSPEPRCTLFRAQVAPLAGWPLAFAPVCVARRGLAGTTSLLQGPGGLRCLWRGRGHAQALAGPTPPRAAGHQQRDSLHPCRLPAVAGTMPRASGCHRKPWDTPHCLFPSVSSSALLSASLVRCSLTQSRNKCFTAHLLCARHRPRCRSDPDRQNPASVRLML